VVKDSVLLNTASSGKRCKILGMGSTESSFLYQTVAAISDHNHPDVPALHVFLTYLTQLEVRITEAYL